MTISQSLADSVSVVFCKCWLPGYRTFCYNGFSPIDSSVLGHCKLTVFPLQTVRDTYNVSLASRLASRTSPHETLGGCPVSFGETSYISSHRTISTPPMKMSIGVDWIADVCGVDCGEHGLSDAGLSFQDRVKCQVHNTGLWVGLTDLRNQEHNSPKGLCPNLHHPERLVGGQDGQRLEELPPDRVAG
jgi:hypothetical protein